MDDGGASMEPGAAPSGPGSMTRRTARVLVVGDRREVALVACRSLGKAGYDVGATGSGGSDPVRASRHVSRYHVLPSLDSALDRWQSTLCSLIVRHRYDVVIATSDAVLAGWRGIELGIPTCPSLQLAHQALIDKHRLAQLAAVADVRYPSTRAPQTSAEDRAHAARVDGPVVIKPGRPTDSTALGVVRLPRPRIVETFGTALAALTEIRRRRGQPLLQDLLVGPKLQAVIIRRAGQTTCRLAYRVLREYPAGGAESMLQAIASSGGTGGAMIAMLERLADAAGYQGILTAEFIQQEGTNDLYLMDPNPRLWGSLAFAELLGFRMTERVVLDALGRPQPPRAPDPRGRRYHHLIRELQWLAARRRIPAGYLRTFSRRDLWSLPSLNDPLPDVRWSVSAALSRLNRRSAE